MNLLKCIFYYYFFLSADALYVKPSSPAQQTNPETLKVEVVNSSLLMTPSKERLSHIVVLDLVTPELRFKSSGPPLFIYNSVSNLDNLL